MSGPLSLFQGALYEMLTYHYIHEKIWKDTVKGSVECTLLFATEMLKCIRPCGIQVKELPKFRSIL